MSKANDVDVLVSFRYGYSALKPEMLCEIVPPPPLTWREKISVAWDDFKQVLRLALVFWFWSLSLAMTLSLVN